MSKIHCIHIYIYIYIDSHLPRLYCDFIGILLKHHIRVQIKDKICKILAKNTAIQLKEPSFYNTIAFKFMNDNFF